MTGAGTQVFLEVNEWQVGEVILSPGESLGFNTQLLDPKAVVTLLVRMTETGAVVISLAGEIFDQVEDEEQKAIEKADSFEGRVFTYLDTLCDSGDGTVESMGGIDHFIVREFSISEFEARRLFSEWARKKREGEAIS